MADDSGIPPFQQNAEWMSAIAAHWKHRQDLAVMVGTGAVGLSGQVTAVLVDQAPPVDHSWPALLMQATVTYKDKTAEGQLIEAVSLPWFEIIRHLERDPEFIFKVGWRKLEEIIAGAFSTDAYDDVILTPPSGDGGRDIIATRHGVGSVRIFGQVKAYKPGHVVKAGEVRDLLGALDGENVSKGLIMTTSDFAPRLHEDAHLTRYIPHRLETMNGAQLLAWLAELRRRGGHG